MTSFFPDMDTIKKHREVVLLISGLMSDPTPIIHVVYVYWIDVQQKSAVEALLLVEKHLITDFEKALGKSLIEAMFHEAELQVPTNFSHNQWINYYDHNDGWINDTKPVYVPSRFYWFYNMKGNISCNSQRGISKIPECTMVIWSPHKTMVNTLLSICLTICQHQAVRDLTLGGIKCEDLPEPHVFNISRNTKSAEIIDCELPKQTLSHLIQQINKCGALRVLNLSNTTLTGCLSSFLPDPHPGLPELHQLKLKQTALNKEDLQHLSNITQSNKLPELVVLDLSHNTLTGCLSSLLPDPHQGLPVLKELHLDKTTLSSDDLQHLFSITYKLPKLQVPNLSGNSLTRCLSSFLHLPGLPELRNLYLSDTALNKEDLQYLLSIAYTLPKLQALNLSEYTLTGCLSSFLTDPHPGLPQLEELNMSSTQLNRDDLQHLTHLIQTHKLPGLKYLALIENRLREMVTDLEHLIEACLNHHQRELKLWMWRNGLSYAFQIKWNKRCSGTNIVLRC